MKFSFSKIGIICLALLIASVSAIAIAQMQYPNLGQKELVIKRGFTKEALSCIECHAKKMPGVMEGWKSSRMSHAGVSCYDCHVVAKNSPMASRCEGVKGSNIYISPMVSSKTCSRCHPQEVEQFLKSGHAKLASAAVMDPKKGGGKLIKLQFHYEGAAFMDKKSYKWNEGTPKGATGMDRAARSSGCQMCHGKADARKPEACGACHLGPDHPNANNF